MEGIKNENFKFESYFSSILCSITEKSDWYTKIHEDSILENWRAEALISVMENMENEIFFEKIFIDIFDQSVRYLRATSQGCYHSPNCGWDNNVCCETCKNERAEQLKDFENTEDFDHFLERTIIDKCKHIKCDCIPPNSKLSEYIDYDNFDQFPEIRLNLLNEIKIMMENEVIDWHPGSNEQVRDIIHPSVKCYVKNRTVLKEQKIFEDSDDSENLRYQWLPAEVEINENKCKFTSSINNLDEEKYPNLKPCIERMFETFLKRLENVLHRSFSNGNFQVIVKIGSIHLDQDKKEYLGGSWHVEGMPYERIVATCINYLDVNNITKSFLEFRKPVYIDEESVEYDQGDSKYTKHHYGIKNHHDGVMNRYLGLIKCSKGSSVVFPNTLQHRVKPFNLVEGENSGSRIIIAFFVIDPDNKIISTADIENNDMTKEESDYFRERLMLFRKYYVEEINNTIFEREFSLCEH